MNDSKDSLSVYLLDGGLVGIGAEGRIIVLEPKVAVEVAQSLILVAMDADPDMDAEQVVEDYIQRHRGNGVN